MAKLSARHQRFVQEFIQDGNAAAAALRAGYSPRSARNAGHRLLRNPDVQEAVAQAQATVSQRAGDSAERVVRDLLRYCDGAAEDRDWRALGKLAELRCKVQGMLTEHIEHSGPGGGPIQLAHDAARRIVEDSGAADLAHTLFERVVQHTGQPGLDVVGSEVAGRAAPAPAKPQAD